MISWFNFTFAGTMEEDRKIGYGRIVAEGQQAVDLAADQHLVAPVHSVRSDRPSDQTNEPSPENSHKNPIGDPAEACQG